ncbi:helix-turn-helix domain-containing protein [Lentzea flava]|uniref:helix-turn-helix domain-containing protein n=1 Tax=Lentzea flava TaxID=103732 RepID=UPI00166FC534|nr:helix-turn-helix transcriptional regulator [Lentzea flava]MCP2205068.1 Helix-turn-helix domain-containing protein [Lentzea flava]
MTVTTSTPYSRDLGDELRRLRQRFTGLRGRALAIQLGWDPSKVSNIEHGKVRASEIDLVQYLTVCGQDIDAIEAFRDRYYNAFDTCFAQVPGNLRTLAMTESMATKITSFDVLQPPVLLQTKSYAQQLIAESAFNAPEEVDRFVDLRMERQTVLRRPFRPECLFFVHEIALQLRVGDAKLMEDQYLRLLFNTHVLRIVPAHFRSIATHDKCTLYEFDKASPVTYSESDTAQVFAQNDLSVNRARRLFERLDAISLDPDQSKDKLMEYVRALRAAKPVLQRS